MLSQLRLLLGMIRFSHTIFALPFALSSAVLAWKTKAEGVLLARLAGHRSLHGFCSQRGDGRQSFGGPALRRRQPADRRPALANEATDSVRGGWLRPRLRGGVFCFDPAFLAQSLAALSICSVLAFVCAYSYTKRFTSLVHFWLGASLLLAPVGAWIAIRGFEQIEIALVLGLAVLFWVTGFDILYACQDVEFDRKAGLFSVPARIGVPLSLKAALICHLLMVATLVLLWWIAGGVLGWVYLAGVTAVALLLLYEHWLVRPDDLSRVNQAFFQVNGVISIGLFFVVLVQVLGLMERRRSHLLVRRTLFYVDPKTIRPYHTMLAALFRPGPTGITQRFQRRITMETVARRLGRNAGIPGARRARARGHHHFPRPATPRPTTSSKTLCTMRTSPRTTSPIYPRESRPWTALISQSARA